MVQLIMRKTLQLPCFRVCIRLSFFVKQYNNRDYKNKEPVFICCVYKIWNVNCCKIILSNSHFTILLRC